MIPEIKSDQTKINKSKKDKNNLSYNDLHFNLSMLYNSLLLYKNKGIIIKKLIKLNKKKNSIMKLNVFKIRESNTNKY